LNVWKSTIFINLSEWLFPVLLSFTADASLLFCIILLQDLQTLLAEHRGTFPHNGKHVFTRNSYAKRVLVIVEAFVCLFVCLSYPAALSKWCKLKSRTFYCGLPRKIVVFRQHFMPLGEAIYLERAHQDRDLL